MSELLNLVVDLESYDGNIASAALRALERAGADVAELSPGLDDPALAWMDETFGGSWSAEAFVSQTLVARLGGRCAAFASYDARGLRFAWLRGAGSEPGVGIFGPFGAHPDHRGRAIAPHLLRLALYRLRTRGYSRALIPAVGSAKLAEYYRDEAGARVIERFEREQLVQRRVRTLVMASGNGTNFQAVLDARDRGAFALDVAALVCNKDGAYCIERARRAQVPSIHSAIWNRSGESRASYDARLRAIVEAEAPELVLLLGWMHVLDASFVNAFPDLINVHPAYLPLDPAADAVYLPDGTTVPAFRGPHAIRDALRTNAAWSGVSVHLVTPATDRGAVLVRAPLRLAGQMPEAAAASAFHRLEHHLVPEGIKVWLYTR